MRLLSAVLLLWVGTLPAFANVTVSSPTNNSTVGTSFLLTATASPCSGQAISSMGYSVDAGATTKFGGAASINIRVSAALGYHKLHVKSWGKGGAACSSTVPVTVSSSIDPILYTDVTVSKPTGLNKLVSPFIAVATGTQCKSEPITAFGWSLDTSSDTTTLPGSSMYTLVTAPVGSHTLHVMSYGNVGAVCTNDVTVEVVPDPATVLPSTATAVKNIEDLTNWTAIHDDATPGTSVGTTTSVSSPALAAPARSFQTQYTNYAGERYNSHLGIDQTSTHFLYDGQIEIPSGSSRDIAAIELDLNQIMPNGQRVIFGFQCNSWSHTWDYTNSTGYTDSSGKLHHWIHSNQACDVQKWPNDMWHHVQIAYSRDDAGNVTYEAVWLDGVEQDLNITVPSVHPVGWAPQMSTNFQVDGFSSTSGASTVYLDKLTLYKW